VTPAPLARRATCRLAMPALLVAAFAAFAAFAATSCRTPRPRATPVSLDALVVEHDADRDRAGEPWNHERITVTGRVEAVEPVLGVERASFTFELVGSAPEARLVAIESGYNVRVLSEVVALLRRAEEKGTPVHATGRLQIDAKAKTRRDARLEIDTLRIEGRVIDTDERDGYRYATGRPHTLFMDEEW